MIDRLSIKGETKLKTLKKAKYDLVLSSIKSLMLEKGINNLKISDIAKEIEIGEATIYRYFGSKINLVIEVGVCLWQDIHMQLNRKGKKENGYLAVHDFFLFFSEGYQRNREVFVFLKEFDTMMIKEKKTKEPLDEYDQVLLNIKDIFNNLYQKGLDDYTIRQDISRDEYYYTTTHMILGICERLAGNGEILSSDELVSDTAQINLAIDMCLQYIKK